MDFDFHEIDLPYPKFKLLFINIFSILYKAATLNPIKLQSDLKEVRNVLQKSNDVSAMVQLLIIFISLLLITKFLFGYISLAANVVAIFPILSGEQPELLLPAIASQAVENIFLAALEILLSYITVKYYIPCKMSLLVIFVVKMLIKMSLSVSTLNVYADMYHHMKYPMRDSDDIDMDDEELIDEETYAFVLSQTLH